MSDFVSSTILNAKLKQLPSVAPVGDNLWWRDGFLQRGAGISPVNKQGDTLTGDLTFAITKGIKLTLNSPPFTGVATIVAGDDHIDVSSIGGIRLNAGPHLSSTGLDTFKINDSTNLLRGHLQLKNIDSNGSVGIGIAPDAGYALKVQGGTRFIGSTRWQSYGQPEALDTTFDGNNFTVNYSTLVFNNTSGSTILSGATGVYAYSDLGLSIRNAAGSANAQLTASTGTFSTSVSGEKVLCGNTGGMWWANRAGANNTMTCYNNGGGTQFEVNGNTAVSIQTGMPLVWGIGVLDSTSPILIGESPAQVSIRNTSSALNVYNAYTNSSNYERAYFRWASNVFTIGTEKAGTGSDRNIVISSPSYLNIGSTTSGASPIIYLGSAVGTFARPQISTADIINGPLNLRSGNGVTVYGGLTVDGGVVKSNESMTVGPINNNTSLTLRSSGTGGIILTPSSGAIIANGTILQALKTSTADPLSSDITSGSGQWWKNTATGETRFYINDGGTIKKTAALAA